MKRTMKEWRIYARRLALIGSNARRKSDGPPIFIVGVQRSGTSLVSAILNSHSRITFPGETHFLIGLLSQLKKDACLRGIQALGISREEAAANIRQHALYYYERYLYRIGKSRWGDKTPNYTELAPQIHEVFGPDVRFVYVLRHGMDVVHSFQDRPWFRDRKDIQSLDSLEQLLYAAKIWQRVNIDFHKFMARHPEICHTVRFEELTCRPKQTARELLDFLGEAWEPRILDYQTFPQRGNIDPKLLTHGAIAPNSGKYHQWPPEHQRVVYELMAPDLERFGYTTSLPDCDASSATQEDRDFADRGTIRPLLAQRSPEVK